jgi:hypothetical protein
MSSEIVQIMAWDNYDLFSTPQQQWFFLLCEISPKCEELILKKGEYSMEYSPIYIKKIIKFREIFIFHHICTSTCNWNISGFQPVVLWFSPVVKPVAI